MPELMQQEASACSRTGPHSPVRISIIIPVYNEIRYISEVLKRVIEAPLPVGCEKEIVVIDDGSTDGTTAVLRKLRDEKLVRLHESLRNSGKGTALRIGLRLATGQIILVQDADLEYDPKEYSRLVQPTLEGKADVVYGSRFRGTPEHMQLPNLVANKILTWLANILYGVRTTDVYTGYKVFRREVLDRIHLECKRFEFCSEVTAKVCKAGIAIFEVPITYRGRSAREGKKIRWYDGFEAIYTLLRYRFSG
jgi:glycosyltransferase involved in cell wall biosynthesis